MKPITIGVNALYLIPGGVGGTEIYLRSLLAALAAIDRKNRYVVFTSRETEADLIPAQPNFMHAPQGVHARFRPARILWEQTMLPAAASRHGVDVLFNPGFTAPALFGRPMVTVFHDLQHKRQPENFRWFDLPFWRLLLWASARRSAHLVADSEATRGDLIAFYRLPIGRIAVAPLGVDAAFFSLPRRPADPPFILCVSTLHPHKNLDRLIRAFAAFHLERPQFSLVIAGMRGFSAAQLEALRRELNLEDAVRFTGWIPRADLHELYASASAFVYPSTFEGFGIPVLEALAAGIPTACSAIAPLTSIAGDAALLLDPLDEAAIAEGLRRITSDDGLRARLAKAGPMRAAQFSWERTARITLDAILEQASRHVRTGKEACPTQADRKP